MLRLFLLLCGVYTNRDANPEAMNRTAAGSNEQSDRGNFGHHSFEYTVWGGLPSVQVQRNPSLVGHFTARESPQGNQLSFSEYPIGLSGLPPSVAPDYCPPDQSCQSSQAGQSGQAQAQGAEAEQTELPITGKTLKKMGPKGPGFEFEERHDSTCTIS